MDILRFVHPTQNRLRELRARSGLERYDIAARLRVDQATVYRWETGRSAIPDRRKHELAGLFGVSIGFLMGWEERAA